MHLEHEPKIPKVDKNTKNEAIKLDDNTCDETKETTDLPMADQNVAESRELTSYIPRRSNRNRTVIEPQAGSEAVKVVKAGIAAMGIAGSRCSSCTKCECAYNRLRKISIKCNGGCKAKHGVLNVNSSTCSSSSAGRKAGKPDLGSPRKRTGGGGDNTVRLFIVRLFIFRRRYSGDL